MPAGGRGNFLELALEASEHRLLEYRGHTVRSAGDAQSAIDLSEREEFDLLIADVGLPDRSGLELLGELRQSA
jgi:DNA-binding response OmpR family regulator